MRLMAYTLASAAACFAVVANALVEKEQFFPACLSIVNSAVKMAVWNRSLCDDRFQHAIVLAHGAGQRQT